MCHTDAQFAISELSRKFSCFIVTKSYLFDQTHSHVACHQSYAPFILFFFSEYWITYLFQGLKMCVLGMALQTEETKSTPENSRLWMYSRCWISSFTQFPNLVFFPITQKVAVLKSCKYTLVTAKLYFLNCSPSRGVVHWEMSEGFTTTASIRQQYWSRVFREIRNRTQTFGVRYLSTQKIELRPSLQAQSQVSFLGRS